MFEYNEKKGQKFDRQIRLWGNKGQILLEKANLAIFNGCLINSEALKNLVLAGINSFTIYDSHKIGYYDIYNNFMIDRHYDEYVSENLAKNLKNLNPDVNDKFSLDDLGNLIASNRLNEILKYNLVISSQLKDSSKLLSNFLWQNNIVHIHCETYGLIGYIKIGIDEVAIVESHPENAFPDFRLLAPFHELNYYLSTLDINHMFDSLHNKKYPPIVIMAKFWNLYKEYHDITIAQPITRDVKDRFKQYLMKKGKTFLGIGNNNPDKNTIDVLADEGKTRESDDLTPTEVLNDILKFFNAMFHDHSKLSSHLSEIFNNQRCGYSTSDWEEYYHAYVSKLDKNKFRVSEINLKERMKFWFMASTLKRFWQKYDSLPLTGTLPDMNCDSDLYVNLLDIYRHQFENECSEFQNLLNETFHPFLAPKDGGIAIAIDLEDIRTFCKNSRNLRLLKGYPVTYEPLEIFDVILAELANLSQTKTTDEPEFEDDSEQLKRDAICFYFCLRAFEHSREEGDIECKDKTVQIDHETLKVSLRKFLKYQTNHLKLIGIEEAKIDRYVGLERIDAIIEESVKFINWNQIATTSAFLGGIVSQQCIKLLTKQYVPLNGLFIYNGITGKTVQFPYQ